MKSKPDMCLEEHKTSNHCFGAHTSIAGGLSQAPLHARAIGADAFAMFTKNQRRWSVPPLTDGETAAFQEALAREGFQAGQVLPHAGYLINLGNPMPEKRRASVRSFIEELRRVRALGLGMLNVHPGSSLGMVTEAEELALIATSLDEAMDEVADVRVVLETTAGQGSAVGWRFEHLRDIIASSRHQERIGVCIDTCHSFAAGYDFRTPEGYARTMDDFDRTIGFPRLCGMHLNDAKAPLGSRLDRHAPLGAGCIGLEAFRLIARDPRTAGIPLILETPHPGTDDYEPAQWKEEIAFLKQVGRA